MSLYVNGFLVQPLSNNCRYFNDSDSVCIIANVLPNRAGHVEYETITRGSTLKYDIPDPFLASVYAVLPQPQVEQLLGLMDPSPALLCEGDIVHRAETPYTVLRMFSGNLILIGAGTNLVLVPAAPFLKHGVDPDWPETWAAVDAEVRGLAKRGFYLTIPFIEVRIRLRNLRQCVRCEAPTKMQCPNRCGTKFCDPCWQTSAEYHMTGCRRVLCAVCAVPCRRECSGCHRVSYCSMECQRTHWQEHKALCA